MTITLALHKAALFAVKKLKAYVQLLEASLTGVTRRALMASAAALCGLVPLHALADASQVSLAGLAYAGDSQTLEQRFPYSRRYEKGLAAGVGSSLPLARIQAAVSQTPPQNFQVTQDRIAELKGRDQAIVSSLVISSETVSVETFGNLRKLIVLIRGQALFFDFKTMTVLRSYPVRFAHIEAFDHQPTEEEVLTRVKLLYEGTDSQPGLFTRYANVLAKATLPGQASHTIKVAQVNLSPDLLSMLPPYLKGTPGIADTWAADLVAEALSTRTGVPVIPYTQGYATGKVMSMRVADGDVYLLKLPDPDYAITVEFTGLKKVKYSENAIGASFVYGSFANVKIEEPLSGTVYMNAAVKNAEVKVVPATQTTVDDFPAFYDSINGLFEKLSDAAAGKGNTWVKAASPNPDIETQIAKTKDMLKLCK
ncbi:hypothetical protein WKW79_35735 [Variovorax robiniae]|uniref:Uncharacterized protein n=1 Tax=Variovorax robiniae TaxID=1836199 RepID=A0ABU8XJ87_9BURK